jgi:hypothetical protein
MANGSPKEFKALQERERSSLNALSSSGYSLWFKCAKERENHSAERKAFPHPSLFPLIPNPALNPPFSHKTAGENFVLPTPLSGSLL